MKPPYRLLLALAFALTLSAQQGSQKCFPAAEATGAAAEPLNICKGRDLNCPGKHTIAAVVTGAPTGCALTLEGSIDGTNFFNLTSTADTSEGSCTATLMWHVVNKPVRWVRPNVTTLSGGTDPTVTVCYLGGF